MSEFGRGFMGEYGIDSDQERLMRGLSVIDRSTRQERNNPNIGSDELFATRVGEIAAVRALYEQLHMDGADDYLQRQAQLSLEQLAARGAQ